jgi:hypothetical protein
MNFLSVALLISSLLFIASESRKLTWDQNPGCPIDICNGTNSDVNLIHVRSIDPVDTFHFIISGSGIGLPSVLLVRTLGQSFISFDWQSLADDNKTGGIKVNGTYDFASSLTFMQLIAFDDVKDTGHMPPLDAPYTSLTAIELNTLSWKQPKLKNESGELFISLESVNSSMNGSLSLYGSVQLRISIGSSEMRPSDFPRLLYTGNSSMINLVLRDMNNPYPYTRYAVQVLVATQPHTNNNNLSTTSTSSMDDEYTPGIFEVFTIELDSTEKNRDRSIFLQWKKVCYTSENYTMKDSTEMDVNKTEFLTTSNDQRFTSLQNSVTYAFFGGDLMETSLTTTFAVNFTFGQSEDKFYRNSNFTSWTLSYGAGNYLTDTVSPLVIVVIICGFGLPLMLIIIGGIFVIIRKYRHASAPSGYGRINT